MTIQELLDMEIESISPVTGDNISCSPEFRVSVIDKDESGIHFIIHAYGHNSETLNLVVRGNVVRKLNPSLSISK